MTHIIGMQIENWLPFAGTHRLTLQPTSYAVVARTEQNPARSNWQGKSSFLEIIPFCLFGDHRKRTEDEWITTGKESGMVGLTLDTGVVLRRSRKLGGTTKFEVDVGRGEHYAGKEADRYVSEQVLGGISKSEFYLLYYAQQKELSRLVTAQSETFASTIREWMELGVLERLEAEAGAELRTRVSKLVELEATVKVICADTVGERPGDPAIVWDPVSTLRVLIQHQREMVAEEAGTRARLELELSKAQARMEVCDEWYRRRSVVDQAASDQEALRELEDQIAEVNGVALGEALMAAKAQHHTGALKVEELRKHEQMLRALVGGQFDGKCPVMLKACPVAETVADHGLKMRTKCVATTKDHLSARATQVEFSTLLEQAERRVAAWGKLKAQADALRARLKSTDEHEEWLRRTPIGKEREDATKALRSASSNLLEARGRYNDATAGLTKLEHRLGELERALANLQDLRTEIARYRRCQRASGRQGAQRRVAGAGMGAIERLGNTLMGDAGVELTFKIRWTLEGKKLATECDACGYRFPGQRDKACPSCKEPRGMHAIDRPGLELSERSGAAEDLVGLGLRLGASAWRRRKRNLLWSVSVLDEPFGSLDTSIRESVAAYLAAALGGQFGFRQSFVVSHTDEINNGMPGRVQITGTRHGSTVEVV